MNSNDAQQLITKVAQDYNTIAAHFSQTRNRQWNEVNFVVDQYVTAGQRVLDLGCGNGRISEVLTQVGVQYTGMDISQGLIEQARKLYPEQEFIVGDMQELPFEDATFDHVLMVASFHHIPTEELRVSVLNEVKRVLKPDGFILMTNWNLHQWRFLKLRMVFAWKHLFHENDLEYNDVLVPWKDSKRNVLAQRYYHGFTKKELRHLSKRAGLQVAEMYYDTNGMRQPRRKARNLVTVLAQK